ncbi:unnamed protein product [Alopecurus aequalis]
MPSWKDGEETSDGTYLSDTTDMDYAPDSISDPSFFGIDVGSSVVCRVHKLKPDRQVAFEGSNTGRRFLVCPLGNQVENCGVVDWIDGEWPDTLQNCLAKLWAMYEESENSLISAKYEHSVVVKNLGKEKEKVEEKYSTLICDMNKLMDNTDMRVRVENFKKIMEGNDKQKFEISEYARQLVEEELKEVKLQNENLLAELQLVTNLHNCDKEQIKMMQKEERALEEVKKQRQHLLQEIELFNVKQKEWGAEKDKLKEDKRKVEYMLFDLLKAKEKAKEKLQTIKSLCEE